MLYLQKEETEDTKKPLPKSKPLRQSGKSSYNLYSFNPEFLKWTLSYLDLGISTVTSYWGSKLEIENILANNVGPDETAHYEPSHQNLCCLQRYLFWSAG